MWLCSFHIQTLKIFQVNAEITASNFGIILLSTTQSALVPGDRTASTIDTQLWVRNNRQHVTNPTPRDNEALNTILPEDTLPLEW